MTTIPIDSIEQIYSCGKEPSIKWHSVQFPELRYFSISLDKFVNALDESAKDDYWIPVIRRLKKLRFDFCAAPLSEEILQDYLSGLVVSLKEIGKPCYSMYPNASKQFELMVNQLESLSKVELSRLLNNVIEILKGSHKDVALVIKEPRLITGAEHSLANYLNLKSISVINSAFLREERCYKQLIVIGPSRWYPEYIFTAPRSSKILIVKYSWIRDQWKQDTIFTEPVKQRISRKQEIVPDETEKDDLVISAEDLLPPSFDFQRIARKATGEIRSSEDNDYLVDARVFILEDGWAVFLEADETASALVLDLATDHTSLVRIKVGEIKIGMYVLLRTGGGGDYIIPVADRIMGNNASIAREFQKEWKTLLRANVRKLGYEQVISKLKLLGSVRASHMNVHNWMFERSIKTDYLEDFRAIMRLIGLEKDTEYYWNMMKLIDRAHLKAGMEIRRMLLEQVKACDLSVLKRIGKMEFALPGEQLVSITAFQVRDISPEVVSVAPWHIGNPFEPD